QGGGRLPALPGRSATGTPVVVRVAHQGRTGHGRRTVGRAREMSDTPLYERDAEAWQAYLAEGNAKQPRTRVSADVLLRDRAGRFLLVDPKYKPDWDTPGGMAEANEPPHQAVQRELREEL